VDFAIFQKARATGFTKAVRSLGSKRFNQEGAGVHAGIFKLVGSFSPDVIGVNVLSLLSLVGTQ
jgi:hypothetical protein